MHNHLLLCVFIFISLIGTKFASAQADSIVLLSNLPLDLKESSGIAASDIPDHYWSHNNKWVNGDPFVLGDIHLFDAANGNIIRTIKIDPNDIIALSDMEDMSQDNSGYTYIADIGSANNLGTKTQFRIHKILDINSYNNNDIVISELIDFTYPNNVSHNAEGMFWYDDYLYIFAKGFANDTVTMSFRVPDVPGTYVAEYLETFVDSTSSPAISSADINPQNTTIALLAYQRCVLVKCFTAPYFFTGSEKTFIDFPGPQADNTNFRSEAVMFVDEFDCIGTNEFKVMPDVSQGVFSFNVSNTIANNFSCLNESCGLLNNYNFNDGLNDWTASINVNTVNANIVVEGHQAKITMDDGGDAKWKVRLKQEFFNSTVATTYRISFTAFANFNRDINILIGQKINNVYEGYIYQVVNLSTSESYYEYEFTTTEPSNSFTRITFDCGDEMSSEVYIDNVCLEAMDCPVYVFTTDSISSATYEASAILDSRGQLKENSTVRFEAGNCIELKDDFCVPASADFEAEIEDCP